MASNATTCALPDASCDDAPGPSVSWQWGNSAGEGLTVSQRNLIYIVGAIIVIVVVLYFLQT